MEEAQPPDLDLGRLYRARFAGVDVARDALWKVLCRHFFQHYVRPDDTVVEVAAGHCEFINNIVASHRVAVDLNPELPEWADPQVRAIVGSSVDLAGVEDQSADVVFVSNFFEHITRPDILATLLRSAGRSARGAPCSSCSRTSGSAATATGVSSTTSPRSTTTASPRLWRPAVSR